MTEIERDKVSDSEKKIYLAFSIYAEKHGYSISNSYQTAFEKLDALGQNFHSYKVQSKTICSGYIIFEYPAIT